MKRHRSRPRKAAGKRKEYAPTSCGSWIDKSDKSNHKSNKSRRGKAAINSVLKFHYRNTLKKITNQNSENFNFDF